MAPYRKQSHSFLGTDGALQNVAERMQRGIQQWHYQKTFESPKQNVPVADGDDAPQLRWNEAGLFLDLWLFRVLGEKKPRLETTVSELPANEYWSVKKVGTNVACY